MGTLLVDRISARRNLDMVKSVRLNQWVVSGEKATSSQLDHLVKKTFRNNAHTIFDVYRMLDKSARIEELIVRSPDIESLIETSSSSGHGLIIVSGHINQVDLMGLYAGYRGARPFGLALPNPGGGYKRQNKIRKRFGVEANLTDRKSLKMAVERLKEGGIVVTGVDRPLPYTRQRPLFFGRKAALPLHYVMVALKANVPIVVTALHRREDGLYDIRISEPIFMEEHSDRDTALIANAEKVLKVVEQRIREAPHQWAMFYPVWPDLMAEVPN